MKKVKQILAIIAIILLGVLYILTLICAILDDANTMRMFMASIISTILFPVLIWTYTFIYRLLHKDDEK